MFIVFMAALILLLFFCTFYENQKCKSVLLEFGLSICALYPNIPVFSFYHTGLGLATSTKKKQTNKSTGTDSIPLRAKPAGEQVLV